MYSRSLSHKSKHKKIPRVHDRLYFYGILVVDDCDKNIKSAAEAVALVANLNNVKDFFLHR